MSTEIGERIKQLRSARDLSLRQLAEVSDISFNQIHKWEKGTSIPNRDSVVKLAKIFNVKPTWLLFGRDLDATESDSIQESFDALKEGGKQMIRDNIQYLLSVESAEQQNGEQ
jgi:transcriptional regulator with XRE-family HTH domain